MLVNRQWEDRMRYCLVVSEKAQCAWSMLSQWPLVEKHKHTHTCCFFTDKSAGLKWKTSSFPQFPLLSLFAQPLCPSSFDMRLCFACLWDSLFVLWSDEEAGWWLLLLRVQSCVWNSCLLPTIQSRPCYAWSFEYWVRHSGFVQSVSKCSNQLKDKLSYSNTLFEFFNESLNVHSLTK